MECHQDLQTESNSRKPAEHLVRLGQSHKLIQLRVLSSQVERMSQDEIQTTVKFDPKKWVYLYFLKINADLDLAK